MCLTHAIEFWTGVLVYTQGRSGPCVKDQMVCECTACSELAESQMRAFAISSVGPSPGDHEDIPMRLAS